MPKFNYTAITDAGITMTGDVEADSLEAAHTLLLTRGYIPSKVSEVGAVSASGIEGFLARLTPIKAPELILFTKQFRTMFRAGVPIINLFQILESQTENRNLKIVLATISRDIKEGTSLPAAFSKHPAAFSNLYCSMVRAGETSGALPDVLERLSYIIEHEHKIRSDIKAALRYPMIVMSFLLVAFLI
ncbi:MAG: type II secretion system F family protein, partial [Desulfobacterales bacterium]